MVQMYAIFDKKAVCYNPPFNASHVAEATRGISHLLDDKKSAISRWPADFALYLIGTYDPQTGMILPPPMGGPQLVLEVAALLPVERQVPNG